MGQEIGASEFAAEDFAGFTEALRRETATLGRWFDEQAFSREDLVAGFELEAWLVDPAGRPLGCNQALIERLADPLVVPELARFNFELNTPPRALRGAALGEVLDGLSGRWSRCRQVAAGLGGDCLSVGILPSLREADLSAAAMSDQNRYRALNEQVLRQRRGRPLRLDIAGREHLRLAHPDVMLEAGTTSLQLHLKVSQARAVRYYNLAQILSAPSVAVAANAPYLFGHALWEETRIPLFEQAVEVGGHAGAAQGPVRRVGFGSGYAQASLFEVFEENLAHYPVLLPIHAGASAELAHLRLHNGTLWRWNRPLIGFDDDGTPHLRIEHRVMAAAPSLLDAIASAAFFFGLLVALGEDAGFSPLALPHATARDNFYAAARHGLQAQVQWFDGRRHGLRELVLRELLPRARQGLAWLEVDAAEADDLLAVVASRVRKACGGSDWQRAWVARHGADMLGLTRAYQERQHTGLPVCDWAP